MIRVATAQDTACVRALWARCFADEGGFNDYFFAHLYEPAQTLLLERAGALCAMVQMLPRTLALQGGTKQITYIYGACTAPEHRRSGLMAQLLEHSFALDMEAGRAASVLIPQQAWLFDFYRPFGYQPAFFVQKGVFTRQGTGCAPRRLTVQDIAALDACYMRAAGDCCTVVRSSAQWREQIQMFDTLGKGVYGWFADAALTAYAFCWADNAQEVVGVTPQQAQGLLNAIAVDTLPWTSMGGAQALGCAKLYGESSAQMQGYMNLMLN